jgi:hypothetical protein
MLAVGPATGRKPRYPRVGAFRRRSYYRDSPSPSSARPARVRARATGPRMASRARRPRARRRGCCARLLAPDACSAIAGAVGIWLVAKDWQDVAPSRRDTAAWRIGLHRRTAPLRAIRRGDGLPSLAAAIAFAVGLVNLVSALTPTIAWRHHCSFSSSRWRPCPSSTPWRCRRASRWSSSPSTSAPGGIAPGRSRSGLMLALAAIQLLKGLDFEEAALSLGAAGLLWWGRDAFYVRHLSASRCSSRGDRTGRRCRRLRHSGRLDDQLRPASRRARLAASSGRRARFGRDPDAHRPPVPAARLAQGASLRRGNATRRPTSFARTDGTRLRSSSCAATPTTASRRRARLSGVSRRERRDARLRDPVGPDDALPGLVQESCAFAGPAGCGLPRSGRASAYSGSTATRACARCISATRRSSTQDVLARGRAIRKVRQSVHRLEAAGYRVEAVDVDEIDDRTLGEIEDVSARWRDGAAERASRWPWTPCAASTRRKRRRRGARRGGRDARFYPLRPELRAARDVPVADAP